MSAVALSEIVFDAGTQVRAAINEQVVADYAAMMTDGVQFPPIVLFHDGSCYYLADGFHRTLAAKRNDWRSLEADVRPGTKTDALWFALGANREQGARLTQADKKHAALLALSTWVNGGKSEREIAMQIGCSKTYVHELKAQVVTTDHLSDSGHVSQRVTGKDGKRYPASRQQRPERVAPSNAPPSDNSRAGRQARNERMRELATEGHSSRQIAAALGMTEENCRHCLRREGIDVPADRVTAKLQRHDPNRILEHIVFDAEHLTADAGLIDFSHIDHERLGAWIDTLTSAKKSLSAFIGRLIQEHKKHVERTEVA